MLCYKVHITKLARADIRQSYHWWAANKSARDAGYWRAGLFDALDTLETLPTRCPLVFGLWPGDRQVRQMLYGLKAQYTHRILFYIDGQQVFVIRVLHVSREIAIH